MEATLWRSLEACGARMEHAVEAMAQQLQTHGTLAPSAFRGPAASGSLRRGRRGPAATPAYGNAYSTAPQKRSKRNVCAGVSAPAAATIAIKPGEGLPADHQLLQMQEAMARGELQA